MRKLFLIMSLLSAVLLSAAENFIKNADFKSLTSAGLPLQWLVRGNADGIRAFDGGVTLGKENQDIWLIQYLPNDLPRGESYEYVMSVTGKGQFRPYCEWSYLDAGVKKLRSTGARFRKLSDNEQTVVIRFSLPDNAQKPYVVINVPKGNQVSIKNLKLVKYIQPLLENASFSEKLANGRIAEWATRGKADQFEFSSGKAVMRSAAGKNAYLIQDMKKRLLPGATYRASVRVSGKSGSRFRFYIESHFVSRGQRNTRSFHAQWLTLKDPVEVKYEFTMPETAIGALAVLNIMDDAEVVFSDLKMELVSKPATPITVKKEVVFGGAWSGKKIAVKGDQLQIDRGSNATRWILEMEPGKRYVVTHSSRGNGRSDSDSGFFFYDVFIRFNNGEIVKIAHEDTGSALQNKSYTFTALAPAGILEIKPLGVDKLFIRELQLREAPSEVEVRPELTFYLQRNNIYSKLHPATVNGMLSNPYNAVSAVIKFNGETYPAKKDRKLFRFTIKTAGLKVGKYEVAAELTDAKGKKSTVKEFINVLPPAETEVTVGPGRLLYVNGEPYLAVGPWAMPNSHRKENIQFAAERGVNFLKTRFADPDSFKEYLDHAQKYGMKVCFNTGSPADESDGAYRTWLHGVESVLTPEIRKHPALLCYFLQDEPFWVGYPLAVLQRCYDELKKLDPYRPVWINAAPRGTHADQIPFAKVCDIYGLDIYPVPSGSGHSHLEDRTISCVGKYALRKAEIAGDTKPIAMALQGFSWRAMVDKKESPRSIYPTAQENRFMTYDCLINESAMLGWWGTGYILKPEFYDVLYAQFDELRRLYPVWIGQASRRLGDVDGIEYRIYYGKDYRVILAANTLNKKMTYSIADTGFTGSQATEWTFNKKVAVKNGKLTDTFNPYDVKIYYQGKLPAPAYTAAKSMKGNPFTADVMIRVNGKIYDGKGAWIWEESGMNTRGSKAVLRKEFTVSGKTPVTVYIAADDMAEVYCNGKKAGEVSDWTFMHIIELDNFLKPGKNVLEVRASDGGILPCGVLAELHVGKTIYPTGSDWQAAVPGSKTFAPAGIVAKFGEKAWGKGLRYCVIDRTAK